MRSRTLPHALVARAKVVLWSAEGVSNTDIASRLQWTKATSENGDGALWSGVCLEFTMNCVRAVHGTSKTKRLQRYEAHSFR